MSTRNSTAAAVELPPNVRHGTTTATAESWEAWHALTDADGWEERSWVVARTDCYPAGVHTQKEATIRGHRIVVFPPEQMHGTEDVAADLLAESMMPVVTHLDEDEWRERGWRESLDRDDDKPLTEAQMFEASGVPYGLAVKADELARKRRVPHALRRDLGVDDA